MRHNLYKVTAPDGRSYIGLTKLPVEVRLYAHLAAARGVDGRRSRKGSILYTIREFEGVGFTVEHIASSPSLEDAREMEAALILAHGTMFPRGMNKQLHKSARAAMSVRDWILPVGNRAWPPRAGAAA